jgi:hopanoid-associated phosphorylase
MPAGTAAKPVHGFRRKVVESANRIMLDSGNGGFTVLRRLDFASLGLLGWNRVTVGDDGLSMNFSPAPSGQTDRIRASGVGPAPQRAGGAAVANAGFSPATWPTLAVTCLAFESRIAAGPGVAVLHGHIPNLQTALEEAIGRGCSGIISFGIAGGLAPDLAPGAWVVASGVVAAHKRYPTDRDWARRLLRALDCAVHSDIAGVDAPVVEPGDKRRLRDATSSIAVDMESHIAAAAAEAHGLPFAACRVIIDPAHRTLPPAALVNLRPDGTPDILAVLKSVIRQPRQFPGLLRVAADARAAQLALRAGRRRLGPGLSFPGFQTAQAASAAHAPLTDREPAIVLGPAE